MGFLLVGRPRLLVIRATRDSPRAVVIAADSGRFDKDASSAVNYAIARCSDSMLHHVPGVAIDRPRSGT